MTESPQQYEPIKEMTSSTNLDSALISEPVPELVVPKQIILNQQPTHLLNLKPQ